MIKRIVIPQNNDIHLSVPSSYVGREVEVLLFPKDEIEDEKINKVNNAARFKGILNEEDARKYHQYLKQARNEWERDI